MGGRGDLGTPETKELIYISPNNSSSAIDHFLNMREFNCTHTVTAITSVFRFEESGFSKQLPVRGSP